jgi:prepilin-type N-terminal cleavage/methylation domain-containing protein/prepilin-type processing-associated H-X9-DG protein
MKKKTAAFTLIELLVVISIIAILAAILFPVFAQAKEAAKKTRCLSNTKQIATGLYMYVGDNDDVLPNTSWEQNTPGFPQTFNPNNPNSYQVHWTYNIQPYVRNWDIFVCPSDPHPVPTDSPCPNFSTANIGVGLQTCDWAAQKNSYIPIYNALPAHDWATVSLSSYPDPTSQIVVAEHRDDLIAADGHKGTSGFYPSQPCPQWTNVGTGTAGANQYSYFSAQFATQQYALTGTASANKSLFKKYDILRVAWDRHTGGKGANYSFADGHAKYESLGATLNPDNYQYGKNWYPNTAIWNSNPCQ